MEKGEKKGPNDAMMKNIITQYSLLYRCRLMDKNIGRTKKILFLNVLTI